MNLFEQLSPGHILTESYPTSNGYDLKWNPWLEIGFLQSRGYEYDEAYWLKYQSYIDNGIGFKLTRFRKRFVLKSLGGPGMLCDIGIGSGQFVSALGCRGYDVNPHAKKWLQEKQKFCDPYVQQVSVFSFWDVLEHIEDPSPLLKKANHVFVSLPIHRNIQACLESKHLRPDEHLWHFTERGIINFMGFFDLEMVTKSDEEIQIGREDIMAYYFTR